MPPATTTSVPSVLDSVSSGALTVSTSTAQPAGVSLPVQAPAVAGVGTGLEGSPPPPIRARLVTLEALGTETTLATKAKTLCAPEASALETAGGIRHALPLLGDAPFVVVNGDVFCDADFAALRSAAERLRADGPLAHLLLVDNPEHHPEGDFHLDSDGLVHADGQPRLTFSGLGAYHPALFTDLADNTPAKLAPLLRAAMNAGKVGGRHHAGRWIDVGTPERLAELDRELVRARD